MISFIVTMYKYGQRGTHSYVLGAWDNFDVALKYADLERNDCGPGLSSIGNKYEFEIIKFDSCEHMLSILTSEDKYPDYMGEVVSPLPLNIFDNT